VDPAESSGTSEDVTRLVQALREGDPGALNRLMPHIYEELHRIAHRELRRRRGASLQTTELLHDAYVKLVDQTRLEVEDRSHFMALAATAMRHILVDIARARHTQKRGGNWQRISLTDVGVTPGEGWEDIMALHAALERLEGFDERMCRVVECRYFGGLTVEETASALGIAPRTVDRAWQKAKLWLYREMMGD
jgi:RNA polymerase sigma factor (TIGR02999 family)